MELFKTLDDKVTYVETLVCLATQNEKILDSTRSFIDTILSNYGLPETYGERIWNKVRRKDSLEEILTPMADKDINLRFVLIQELIMIFLLNQTYKEEKHKLIEICKTLNINVKLEAVKEQVMNVLKQREDVVKKTQYR